MARAAARALRRWLRTAVACLLALATILLYPVRPAAAAADECPVKYSPGGTPLLFGGVNERCTLGCAARSAAKSARCYGWLATSPPSRSPSVDFCPAAVVKQSISYVEGIDGGAMLKWSPCDLEPFLRGRTLWLVGDSLTKQMALAVSCLIMDFADDQKTCAAGSRRIARTGVEGFEDIAPENGASPCVHLRGPQGGRICAVAAFMAQQLTNSTQAEWGFPVRYGSKKLLGGILPVLRARYAQPHDIFVVNVGRHHRHNDQRPGEYPGRFRAGLHALGRYVEATRKEWPHVLWREVPATHPPNPSKGPGCAPTAGFRYNTATAKVERIPGESPLVTTHAPFANRTWDITQAWPNHDVVAREVLPSYNIPIVPGYDVSVGMNFAHRGTADCSHSCIPGVPEVQAYELFKALKSGVTGIRPLPPSVKLEPPCILRR